jgi:ribosome maturation factor RimP
MIMNLQSDEIQAILEPALAAGGFEWVGMETISGQGRPLLRIYADLPGGGINARQLGEVGHLVIDNLRLAGIDTEAVRFEVSSPGLNRQLFTLKQCEAFVGQVIAVKLRQSIEGRGRYKGVLTAIKDEQLLIQPEAGLTPEGVTLVACPWSDVIKANVVADLNKYLTSKKAKR